MLDWLKRKGPPPATEQSLESEGQKPLTDERLERLLGRLGPDSRTRSEPIEARRAIEPPPTSTEPVAEALNENAPPASEPVAEAPLPSVDGGGDTRFAPRREDLTIT